MRLPHLTAIVPRSVVIPYNNTYLINHEIAAKAFWQNELIYEILSKSKLAVDVPVGGSHRSRHFTSVGHFVETN
jgi:hypothetical protein